MLTIFPGLTAGATLCRRFAPGYVICSVWGEVRIHGSSDVEPRRGDQKIAPAVRPGKRLIHESSAESAKQQSPGRKPWERHAYEPSPERAAQVFGRL